jgi:hypothetical protein
MNNSSEETFDDARQMATLLLEAQQALAEARQVADDPAVLVSLLRIEQCLLRIGLLRQSTTPAESQDSETPG